MNSSPAKSPRIRIAVTQEQKDAAFRLRYKVSILELHKKYNCADHLTSMVHDELDLADRSTILFAEIDSIPVATIRVTWGGQYIPENFVETFSLSRFSRFPHSAFSFTSRLVVDNEWRHSSVLAKLLDAGYRIARDHGSRFDFCHCTPALVSLYEQLGYRRYKSNVIDPDVGYHVPMVLLLENHGHFHAIHSPLQRPARYYQNSLDTTEWFSQEFYEYQTPPSARFLSEETFLEVMTASIHRVGIPLFQNLTDSEIQRFLREATVMNCLAGDKIIRHGDVGSELFVILSGFVDIRRDFQGNSLTVTTLGKGQIVGEIGFLGKRPRSADVVALTDLELIVLSQDFFERMMRVIPEVTIRVLLNLSIALCQRLEVSNDRYVDLCSRTDGNTMWFF